MLSRRQFLGAGAAVAIGSAAPAFRPNVVLIMSDDQGFGDISLHGNRELQTPNMDRVALAGVQFTQFQVCPVCAPTRASLLTGRYNYRTGVVDTFLGRALMDPREVTAAEIFRKAGYRTGIFGKWHLGDNYPMRAQDQGFDEALVHGGGGLAQPADPPPGNGYFDPVLARNGKLEKTKGYCTDIFFDEALRFISNHAKQPFFLYLPTNAPHTPLQVEDRYVQPFLERGIEPTTAKIYGMLQNLDENMGKLHAHLDKLRLRDNTILIFMTDNGPQQKRFNAGMRGLKGTVYQGGIRVPCFLQWPAKVRAGTTVDRIAAHIDVLPTLIEACGLPRPGVEFDGRSLWQLVQGRTSTWADRTLHSQWHRGDEPVLFRAHAARTQRWKLIHGKELYDLDIDPSEENDVAAQHPEIVAQLRRETELWFLDMASTRGGYAPPRIVLGAPEETHSLLTRQDWRGPRASWEAGGLGHWEVEVRGGKGFDVELQFAPAERAGEAVFRLGTWEQTRRFKKGDTRVFFEKQQLPEGPGRLEAILRMGTAEQGVLYVEAKQIS